MPGGETARAAQKKKRPLSPTASRVGGWAKRTLDSSLSLRNCARRCTLTRVKRFQAAVRGGHRKPVARRRKRGDWRHAWKEKKKSAEQKTKQRKRLPELARWSVAAVCPRCARRGGGGARGKKQSRRRRKVCLPPTREECFFSLPNSLAVSFVFSSRRGREFWRGAPTRLSSPHSCVSAPPPGALNKQWPSCSRRQRATSSSTCTSTTRPPRAATF